MPWWFFNHRKLDCMSNRSLGITINKNQSFVLLALCEGNHSHSKSQGPVMGKSFHIMTSSCYSMVHRENWLYTLRLMKRILNWTSQCKKAQQANRCGVLLHVSILWVYSSARLFLRGRKSIKTITFVILKWNYGDDKLAKCQVIFMCIRRQVFTK